jgi:adenylate kinase
MLEKIAKVDLAIDLQVNEENLVKRLTLRRTCKNCAAVYHLEYNPPNVAGRCDKCGGELYQRSDDTEKTVRERLKVYRNQTLPLVAFYKEKGVLEEVDGEGGIPAVHDRLAKIIKAK